GVRRQRRSGEPNGGGAKPSGNLRPGQGGEVATPAGDVPDALRWDGKHPNRELRAGRIRLVDSAVESKCRSGLLEAGAIQAPARHAPVSADGELRLVMRLRVDRGAVVETEERTADR